MMSMASVAVLVSCLVIIGSAIMAFANINSYLKLIGEQNVIMVFTDETIDTGVTNAIGDKLKAVYNVKSVNFIPREESWKNQIESLGDGAAALQGIVDNPLPNSFEVVVDDLALFEQTVEQIKNADENIISVRENSQLAKQLSGIRSAVSWISSAIIVLLFMVSLFIISNTIRLTMFARRLEINIMKLVGATDWFIRWPFMIEGMLIGFVSGLTSLCLVWCIYSLVENAVAGIASMLNASLLPFGNYVWQMLFAFLLISMGIGVGGSFISMSKYLKEEGAEVIEV